MKIDLVKYLCYIEKKNWYLILFNLLSLAINIMLFKILRKNIIKLIKKYL